MPAGWWVSLGTGELRDSGLRIGYCTAEEHDDGTALELHGAGSKTIYRRRLSDEPPVARDVRDYAGDNQLVRDRLLRLYECAGWTWVAMGWGPHSSKGAGAGPVALAG